MLITEEIEAVGRLITLEESIFSRWMNIRGSETERVNGQTSLVRNHRYHNRDPIPSIIKVHPVLEGNKPVKDEDKNKTEKLVIFPKSVNILFFASA